MNELEQLKNRINNSGFGGIKTAHVRDDYEPIGDMMMRDLMDSGEYVQRKVPMQSFDQHWRIFKKEYQPY